LEATTVLVKHHRPHRAGARRSVRRPRGSPGLGRGGL